MNWYNHEEIEELRRQHSKRLLDLTRRLIEARKKENPLAVEKARKAIAKHRAKGEKMKAMAEESGFYWY